jgi:hypothetical protein
MARRAKAPATPNTANPELVNQLLDRWDEVQEKRDSDLGAYRAKCKEHKKSETAILTEAKARGVNPKLLKTDIRVRKLRRQIAEIETALDDEYEAEYEAIMKATAQRDGGWSGEAVAPTKTAATAAEKKKAATRAANATALEELEQLH